MNAAKQACRPKHQVLVRKCYPKFTKNNAEVKANSSELSYLLYYASTRRSKLQKVGDFLDKRTTADVWKVRTGNVQVTLQILKALIEKCPRDLPLFAAAVLRSLRTILKSNDVAMVEESVPTFEALCAHQDPASLAADNDYISQYEEIVQLYAEFASKEPIKTGKTPVSWPVAIRFRKSGLQALKAVASSESLGSETGRQLAVIIPVILLNIYSETGEYLRRLESRENEKEEHEKVEERRRRQSISTVRTEEEEADPVAASGTTEEADKIAEEEAGMIALEALRHIFLGVNRGQLRLATSAVLKFIGSHVKPQEHLREEGAENWATTLMSMICSWAPVQDRYAILVCIVEALVRSPIVEDDLERQLVLATVVDHLLGSTINFIGLSVMDVLVGLISHTLLLLQLGGPGTSILPHHQQNTSVFEKDTATPKASGNLGGVVMEVVKEPSQFRLQLLNVVKQCMASLAVHVYYTDQISDMVAAILSRLKPSPMAGISAAEAIEDPSGAVKSVADSANLRERSPGVDRFFSFETARLAALETVKRIIETANARRPDGSSASVSRRSVSVRAWEGTQWLLRDPSGQVRKSYVDALVTWLTLEKKKEDLKFVDDYRKKEKENQGALARRAVSNASQREKSPRRGKTTFLALLHLAIYENALQFVDSEPDLLLLHLLLTTLVNKLGVNAIRTGLPMILRLQEDISTIENPGAKVRIGSLVHGYLWTISMALDFETSTVGRIIHSEISRRNEKGLWVKSIRVPPLPIDRIETPHSELVKLPADLVQTEALKPFDNRDALVDKIADGYADSLRSPPSSPPGSPGRDRSKLMSAPAGRSMSIAMTAPATLAPPLLLSYKVKEDLLADWSRETCLATNTKDPSSASMTGSRTATSAQKNNYLGVSIPNGNLDSAANSPVPSPRRAHSRPPSMAYGLVGRVASPHRHHSPSRTPGSNSSVHSTVRVDDLKRVLSGSAPRTSYSTRVPSRRNHTSVDSSASESLVSVHSLSDASFVTADHAASQPIQSPSTPAATHTPTTASRPSSTSGAPGSPGSPTHAQATRARAYSRDAVPPVPPIPDSLRDKSVSPAADRPKTAPGGNANGTIDVRKSRSVRTSAGKSVKERSASRGRATVGLNGAAKVRKPDFGAFLDSIDVGGEEEEGFGGSVRRVPY
ncbi:plasma membrane localization protein [Paraconiothyrium brasiliense]|uniref:Plasma membrane localization protein n=1 Tax=Paraconiothyrium brasiliense TaxID=300254 RepID=A0ABR3RAL7_9PLEO